MYTKSENPQAIQSQKMVTDALLTLMKLYPYKDITITQICQEAKVVRQTFYRNFESITDILELYLDNMIKEFASTYLESQLDIYQCLKNFFDFALKYKDFFVLVEKNDLFFLLNRSISVNIYKFAYVPKIIETINEPKLEVYVLGFIASTICSILSLWVKNDFEDSSEKLANLSTRFLSGLDNPINLGSGFLD